MIDVMKKILIISLSLLVIGIGCYLYTNHYYFLFIEPPTYSGTELTRDEIEKIQNYLDYRNEIKDYPYLTADIAPVEIGIFNGRIIEERYWCSDNCTDNGILYLTYKDSTEENCTELGGHKIIKFGWGSHFVGCSPLENKYSE